MAIWEKDGERFDDKLKRKPGEPGFKSKKGWNYLGTPNWEPLPQTAETPEGESDDASE